jgi:hypothetical protein
MTRMRMNSILMASIIALSAAASFTGTAAAKGGHDDQPQIEACTSTNDGGNHC